MGCGLSSHDIICIQSYTLKQCQKKNFLLDVPSFMKPKSIVFINICANIGNLCHSATIYYNEIAKMDTWIEFINQCDNHTTDKNCCLSYLIYWKSQIESKTPISSHFHDTYLGLE